MCGVPCRACASLHYAVVLLCFSNVQSCPTGKMHGDILPPKSSALNMCNGSLALSILRLFSDLASLSRSIFFAGRRLSGWMIFYWITFIPVRMSSKLLVVNLSMARKDIIQTTKTSRSGRRRLIFADLLSVRNRRKSWMLEMMYPNGVRKFSAARNPLILSDTGVENCQLFQSFCGSEQLGFNLDIEQGEGFVEGMLMDGWLLKLVLIYGSVEDCIASWTLTKLLYSSNTKLRLSASDFWDSVLSLNEADKLLVNLGYFPSYSVLKGAVLSYGYLCDTPCTKTCNSESAVADTSDDGPPQNIIAWLRVVSACCKIRKMHSVFSPSEAEDLLVIVISLFLDRQLEGLLLILGDCLNSLILYFNTSEWESSCLMVAESIARRITMDLNCLRIVDCITATNDRSKFLRSQLALQLLKISFGLKVANVEKILKLVTSINVKEKECNFFRLYVYLVLMDNLLFSSDAFRDKHAIINSWRNYLRNCSTQIGCTDWRFYASKVRNKASYVLQGAILKRSADSGSISAQ